MKTIRIDANLQWRAELDQRTGVWVAVCDALKQAVQADSWTELCATINEATNVLFTDLLEDGSLDTYLREKGWRASGAIPRVKPTEGIAFDVPADFVRGALRATA